MLVGVVVCSSTNHARPPGPASWFVLCCTLLLLVDGTFDWRWRLATTVDWIGWNAQEPLADDILTTTVLRHRTTTYCIAFTRNDAPTTSSNQSWMCTWGLRVNVHSINGKILVVSGSSRRRFAHLILISPHYDHILYFWQQFNRKTMFHT